MSFPAYQSYRNFSNGLGIPRRFTIKKGILGEAAIYEIRYVVVYIGVWILWLTPLFTQVSANGSYIFNSKYHISWVSMVL